MKALLWTHPGSTCRGATAEQWDGAPARVTLTLRGDWLIRVRCPVCGELVAWTVLQPRYARDVQVRAAGALAAGGGGGSGAARSDPRRPWWS